MKERKNKIIKVIINIAMLALIAALLYIALNSVLPGFIDVLAEGNNEAIEAYLKSFTTFKGYLVAFLLQFIQIITIFLPSVPIQVSCGFIFGTVRASIVCYLGYVSANAVVFLACRALHGGLERLLPSSTGRSLNSSKAKQILESKYPAFNVFLASILPLIPNGTIPYVAAKTEMKFSSFIIAVALGCIPTVYTVCAVGGRLHRFDYLTAALMCLPLIALVVILFWQKKNLIVLYEKLLVRLHKNRSSGSDDSCESAQNTDTSDGLRNEDVVAGEDVKL